MSSIDWTHAYCMTCDKQTDGTTYCSESCRLAEYEQSSSSPSTGPSSPAFNSPSYPWAYSPSTPSNKSHALPAYNVSHYPSSQRRGSVAPPQKALSPSSSHASLSSMKSSSSTASEASQLSDAAKRELHAYASCFEHARSSRKQSQ